MKWKASTLEHLAKVVFFDELLENQGDKLSIVLIKA
jgi:hypothetical protein